jgi:hypothetical protein
MPAASRRSSQACQHGFDAVPSGDAGNLEHDAPDYRLCPDPVAGRHAGLRRRSHAAGRARRAGPVAAHQAYRNDPPGTWYGDTSGVPASESTTVARRSACPTAPDGSERDVTGSVSAGIGHSSRFGNSNWQAASLNYCKESADEDGNPRSFNLRLDVGTFDGAMPGAWMGPPPGPHPWGRGPR